MSDYRTYVTQTGFGLERDAKFNNTHVDFAVLVVGDGVLPDSASPAAQTDLIHQVREYAITIEKDEKDPNVWIARAEIPASDGGFFIKEAGIKTKGKALYAYARQAGDYKPLLEEGQGKSYTIRLKFVPGNADAIQIKIDPSVQFATPTDLSNAVKAHIDAGDPHDQYVKKTNIGSVASLDVQIGVGDNDPARVLKVGGFGIGGACVEVNDKDFHVDRETGFYMGYGMAHAPRDIQSWWFFRVLKHNERYHEVEAITLDSDAKKTFHMSNVDGEWSEWVESLTENNVVRSSSDKTRGLLMKTESGNAMDFLTNQAKKNYLINSRPIIWQRGDVFSSSGYTADRWFAKLAGMQSSFVDGGVNEILATESSATFELGQCVESKTVTMLRTKEMTFSFAGVCSGIVGDVRVGVSYSNATDTYESQNTVVAYSTFTPADDVEFDVRVKFEVPSDAIGLRVYVKTMGGQNIGAKFRHINSQLELGETGSPYSLSSYAEEFLACTRYYECMLEGGSGRTAFWSGVPSDINKYYGHVQFSTEKRAVPSIAFKSEATGVFYDSPRVLNGVQKDGFSIYCTPSATTSVAVFFRLIEWIADAEL